MRYKLEEGYTRDITNLMHMENMVMGIAFGTAVTIFRNSRICGYKGTYNQIKLCDIENNVPKSFPVSLNRFAQVSADNFSKIPGSPVAYWVSEQLYRDFAYEKMCHFAMPKVGLQTGDNNKFVRLWFEVNGVDELLNATTLKEIEGCNCKWFPYNKGGDYRKWYGNYEYVVNWKDNGEEIKNFKDSNGKLRSRPQNVDCFFKESITWSFISSSFFGVRYSPKLAIFDVAGSSLFPKKEDMFYLTGLMCSKISTLIMAIQNPTLNFQVGNVANIPVIICNKEYVNDIVNENVMVSKLDWDSFETSWDFKRHPLVCLKEFSNEEMQKDLQNHIHDMNLMKAVYTNWENECYLRFKQLKANEEELNRIFIDIYGLQDELTPEVEDKDVTVRKADLGRDIRSFISYAVGCMFGRYSLDVEGVAYAGGEWDNSKYTSFIPDADNVIPITDEEYFSDDIVSRFVDFVRTVYGQDTLEDNLDFIAQALGGKGDTSREVIRNYFVKDFYADHLKVYQKRPIYWLFDSGKQNGFKALIYMHRYDADTVGRVRTDYLHKAQKYVESAMQSAQYTIENAFSSSDKSKATKAVTKYTKQLAEMKIYDEAIAHIANRRIEIDLDDGVKVNYAKFQGVEVAQEGKKALKVDLLGKI